MKEKRKRIVKLLLILFTICICILTTIYTVLKVNTDNLLKEMEQAYKSENQSELDDIGLKYLNNKALYFNEKIEEKYLYYYYSLEDKRIEKEIQAEVESYKKYKISNLEEEVYGLGMTKIKFTVTNNGTRTASYMEFDIKMYDSQKNVINTEWTNWSGNLYPSERCIVETFVDMYGNEDSYSVILSEKRDS